MFLSIILTSCNNPLASYKCPTLFSCNFHLASNTAPPPPSLPPPHLAVTTPPIKVQMPHQLSTTWDFVEKNGDNDVPVGAQASATDSPPLFVVCPRPQCKGAPNSAELVQIRSSEASSSFTSQSRFSKGSFRCILYFFDQTPRLLYISRYVWCGYYSRVASIRGRCLFLWVISHGTNR